MTVRDHLQHLMTASALAACSREPTPVKEDPGPLPSAAASSATAKPKPMATSTAGYLVVDMLPTPARCLAVAKNASGAQLAGAQLVLSCGSYGSGPPAVGRPVTHTMTDY